MKIYIESLKIHLKIALEYKKSFIFGFLSQFLVCFSYYFIILALFDKFSNIRGFTLYQVLFTYGIIHFGYSMNEVFNRGVDHFDRLIVRGEFDRLLLRPKNIILQIMCTDIDYIKISRVLQSIIILIIAMINMDVAWSIDKIILLILMLIGSVVIFFTIFLLMASISFLTVQGIEIKNLFTDGGKHLAQYPIGIFKKGVAFIFSYIIPYAFINYYPLLYIIGNKTSKLYILSPLVAMVYIIPSILIFKLGMKKYTSVGS